MLDNKVHFLKGGFTLTWMSHPGGGFLASVRFDSDGYYSFLRVIDGRVSVVPRCMQAYMRPEGCKRVCPDAISALTRAWARAAAASLVIERLNPGYLY
jgi:hypothetical protein